MEAARGGDRLLYWDNIKGFLIALVVFAHCLLGFISIPIIGFLAIAIYYVHMPAFVFVSGRFGRSKKARSADTVLRYVLSYLFVILIYITADVVCGREPHILSAYHSEWYLISLLIWRMLSVFLKKSRWTVAALVCLAVVAGFWTDLGGNTAFTVNKVITFFPFFMAGYLLDEDSAARLRSRGLVSRLSGAALLLLAAEGIVVSYPLLDIGLNDVLPNAYESAALVFPIRRIVIFGIAACFIMAMLRLSPDKKLPLITKAGKNSFAIFLIHRPLTFIVAAALPSSGTLVILTVSVVFTVLSLIVLGSDRVSNALDRFLDACADCLAGRKRAAPRAALSILLALALIVPAAAKLCRAEGAEAAEDPIFRVISDERKSSFDNAFTLLFCGDLLLLEDQVKNGFTGSGYDFSTCFELTKDYISGADYAIGVFEGPLGGTARNYSSSNYDDGKELYINLPDEWADAVKDAGFDLVTLANNHILDMGEEGKDRTIDVLREKDIDYVGAYKDAADKNGGRVKLVETGGLRLAILSYTASVNSYSTEDLMSGTAGTATSLIVGPSEPQYAEILAEVEKDFEDARTLDPDLIVVLPHWGTQFEDEPDRFQTHWRQVFAELGADIILGDHTHSVQPVGVDDGVFTLYCPGNYANIYREHNGDCSAMVEVYIDRESKDVIGGSVIPMWTSSSLTGNYRAVPIYEILTDPAVGSGVTTYDLERVEEAQRHITKTMLGVEIGIELPQERYYFDADGFMRTKAAPAAVTDRMRSGTLYPLLTGAGRVCFVGDSVTEGTKNGGVPWYEPLEAVIPGEIVNCGWGGATTKSLLNDHLQEIVGAEADLYVVAIGTNDVRYRNQECAMTAQEYTENLQLLRDAILARNEDAEFVFIAPWTSTDGDTVSRLPYPEKRAMNEEYSAALQAWADENGDRFVNANEIIDYYLDRYPQSDYLIDFIHPNYLHGVELYALAALAA